MLAERIGARISGSIRRPGTDERVGPQVLLGMTTDEDLTVEMQVTLDVKNPSRQDCVGSDDKVGNSEFLWPMISRRFIQVVG